MGFAYEDHRSSEGVIRCQVVEITKQLSHPVSQITEGRA
jgi:hypothetical protein